jgi:hypothetical protein
VSGGESMKKAAAGLYEDVLVTEALDKNARHLHPVRSRARTR